MLLVVSTESPAHHLEGLLSLCFVLPRASGEDSTGLDADFAAVVNLLADRVATMSKTEQFVGAANAMLT